MFENEAIAVGLLGRLVSLINTERVLFVTDLTQS